MTNGLYKATLKMRYQGQALQNVLWYRSALEGTFATDLLIDAATAIGRSIINHIWASAWKAYAPADMYFDGVSIAGYNDLWELLYNNTIEVATTTNEAPGTGPGGEVYLPLANCANIAFSLKNHLIANPLFPPPKKGLVAISPVKEEWAGNDGTLNDTGTAVFTNIANTLGVPLPWDYGSIDLPFTNWTPTIGLPGAFIPMRVKTWQFDLPQIIGGQSVYKHIETSHVRKLLGYRRSRRVEG